MTHCLLCCLTPRRGSLWQVRELVDQAVLESECIGFHVPGLEDVSRGAAAAVPHGRTRPACSAPVRWHHRGADCPAWSKLHPPSRLAPNTHPACPGSQSKPRQLCFFAFLPNILDTGAKGRNEYIDILKKLANKWVQAAAAHARHLHAWGVLALCGSQGKYRFHCGCWCLA